MSVGVIDPSPLGSKHDLALVETGWPTDAACADGRSFRAFADALRAALHVKDTPLES